MPYHHIYKCPKGFAFVGFENIDTVLAVTKDSYHHRNTYTNSRHGGKMTGTIGTISGYGAYANLAAAAQPQVIIPQIAAGGQTQYTAVQVPAAAAATGGYVFDPATNTYYQLPGTMLSGAGLVGAASAGAYG